MMRFGLIGAGAIAHAFSKAAKASGYTLETVASRSLDKAIQFQTQYGYLKAYDTYEALYQDESVDAIYVATPHGLHYEQMLEILRYKKHILCEKAFTLNAVQAAHIFKLASEAGVYVMEAMWTRFLPVTRAIQNYLQSGILGHIKKMAVQFSFSAPFDAQSRLYNPALGGGALLDIGIYPITYANIFLGAPLQIDAIGKLTPTQVDGEIEMTYHYPHATAHLRASILEATGDDAWITCEKGTIHVPQFWCAQKAFIYDEHHVLIEEIHLPHKINGYEYELAAFVKAASHQPYQNLLLSSADTIGILEQMDDIRRQIGVVYPNEGLKDA